MPEQLRLCEFDGDLQFRSVWDLRNTKTGIIELTSITQQLIDEALTGLRQFPVTFFDIAKKKLRMAADENVAPDKVHLFDTIVHQVRDERFRLKSRLEENGYKLVLINERGESALHGGDVSGFNLRASEVGVVDDQTQLNMTFGKLQKFIERHPELGGDPLNYIEYLRTRLAPSTRPPQLPA